MSCAQCTGIEELFDRRYVRLERWKHERIGPPATTKRLIDALLSADAPHDSLLDIGGGLGAIQSALAKEGAGRIQVVDAAPAYLEASRRRAEREGYAESSAFLQGNFVDIADDVDEADIVTLDRVICCYDDVRSLVARSAAKSRSLYGLVYPRTHLIMKTARAGINLFSAVRGSPYRFFLHDEELVRRTVLEAGLTPVCQQAGWTWNVEVYRR